MSIRNHYLKTLLSTVLLISFSGETSASMSSTVGLLTRREFDQKTSVMQTELITIKSMISALAESGSGSGDGESTSGGGEQRPIDEVLQAKWLEWETGGTLSYTGYDWNTLVYGNGYFVAVNGDGKSAYSTDDGKTWIAGGNHPLRSCYALTYADGKFMMVDYSKFTYSADNGVSWTAGQTLPVTPSMNSSVIYINGSYLVGCSGPAFCISENIVDWKSMAVDGFTKADFMSYGNDRVIAINREGKGAYSDDGKNWNVVDLPIKAELSGIAYGNGRFVAITWSTQQAIYSNDGIDWHLASLPNWASSWSELAYGEGRFVVTPAGTNRAAYSQDGMHWFETVLPGNGPTIAYGNGHFIATGQGNGKIYLGTFRTLQGTLQDILERTEKLAGETT